MSLPTSPSAPGRMAGLLRWTWTGQAPDPAWLAPALVGGVAAGACTLVTLVDPAVPGRYPTCPFLALTGRYCPGCGTLRAVHQLFNGNLGAAVGLNPLAFLVLPVAVYVYLVWGGRLVFGLRLPTWRMPSSFVQLVPVALVAYWIARNLPWAPLRALAP